MKRLLFLSLVISCTSCGGNPSDSPKAYISGDPNTLTLPSGNHGYIEEGTGDTIEYVKKEGNYETYDTVRHKYIVPVADPSETAKPTTAASAKEYVLTYFNGFDKAEDITSNQLGNGSVGGAIVKSGSGSFHSVVKAGDPSISNGWRSEQQWTKPLQNPKEGAVQFDIYFESWEKPDWGASCIQWHPNNNDNGGSALFFMEVCQQKWNMYCWKNGYMDRYDKPSAIKPGQWYNIRMEFKWSQYPDGYFNVLIDNKPYWSYTGATQMSEDQPYLKLGQNHFPGTPDDPSPHGMVLDYDNLKIFTKK